MVKNKTVQTSASVDGFIQTLENATMKKDSFDLIALITRMTGLKPKMWASAISIYVCAVFE